MGHKKSECHYVGCLGLLVKVSSAAVYKIDSTLPAIQKFLLTSCLTYNPIWCPRMLLERREKGNFTFCLILSLAKVLVFNWNKLDRKTDTRHHASPWVLDLTRTSRYDNICWWIIIVGLMDVDCWMEFKFWLGWPGLGKRGLIQSFFT